MSVLSTTEQVQGDSPYKDYQLGEQANGFVATLFYVKDSEELESEHGSFYVMQGLGFNAEATTEDELLNSCFLAGIIPNTMLKGKIKNGAFGKGQAYKLTKTWSKGDVYNGRKSKGHGYSVEKYQLSQDLLDKLTAKHNELVPDGMKDIVIEEVEKVEI